MQGVTTFALQSYVISFPVFCIVDILSKVKVQINLFSEFKFNKQMYLKFSPTVLFQKLLDPAEF